MDRYEKERSGSQEVEEYLKTLLDSEVKPLWPKGWMQSRYMVYSVNSRVPAAIKCHVFKVFPPNFTCPFLFTFCFRALIRESRKLLGLFTSLP